MPYILNNITYRGVSSKAIETFYSQKSHILGFLSDSRYDFSESARELMLLFLNNYSRWILSVETQLLHTEIVDEDDISIIMQRYGELAEHNKLIFQTHSETFLPEFLDVWRPNHNCITNGLKANIRGVEGMTRIEAFPMIIDALVNSLYSSLFEIREVDAFLGSDLVRDKVTTNRSSLHNLCAYIDENSMQYSRDTGVHPIVERIKLYKNFLKEEVLPVVLFNTSQQRVIVKDGRLQGMPSIVEYVSKITEIPNVELLKIELK